MDRREYLYVREFLNLPRYGSSAHVIAEVALERADDEGSWFPEVTLTIGDCYRTISFDLPIEGEHRANTLGKLDRLLEIIGETRGALVRAAGDLDVARADEE